MKKIFTTLFAAMILSLLGVTANAASTAAVSVSNVSVGSSGDVFIKTSGSFVNQGCTNTSKYLLPKEHAAKKELLAILLTAAAAGNTVVLAVNGCTSIGAQTYSSVFNVAVNG